MSKAQYEIQKLRKLMADSFRHPTAFSFDHATALRLHTIFRRIDGQISTLRKYLHVDSQRIVASLKGCHQLLSASHDRLESTDNEHKSTVGQRIKDWKTCLHGVLVEAQFYDIIQQQLQHVQYPYQDMLPAFESDGKGNGSHPLSIYVLKEITQLHRAHLRQIYHEYEVGVAKGNHQLKKIQLDQLLAPTGTDGLAFAAYLQGPGQFLVDTIDQIKALLAETGMTLPTNRVDLHYMEELMNDLQQSLTQLATEAQHLDLPETPSVKKEALARIRKQYTMHSERVVHDQSLMKLPKNQPGANNNYPEPDNNQTIHSPDRNLGDVELF